MLVNVRIMYCRAIKTFAKAAVILAYAEVPQKVKHVFVVGIVP